MIKVGMASWIALFGRIQDPLISIRTHTVPYRGFVADEILINIMYVGKSERDGNIGRVPTSYYRPCEIQPGRQNNKISVTI